MLIFGLFSTSVDQPGWSVGWNPIQHPSPAKKMKCSFLDYVQLLIISLAGRWAHTPSATPLQPGKWNAHFWIMFNFWWSARLVDGLKPHLPPSLQPKNEMLIFGLHSTCDNWPGWFMDLNPILPPLSSQKNEMLIFGLHSTSDDRPGLVYGLEPHPCHCSPARNVKCSFLDYIQLLMIGQAGRWTQTPCSHPSPAKK